jgi:membrane protease YdiL (CAAX protease family)
VAKSRLDEQAGAERPRQGGYLEWSRDPAVGLFAVLPLWLLYEGLRFCLTPQERNGAEVLMAHGLGYLGPSSIVSTRVFFGVTVLAAAWSIHRRRLPWLRVGLVTALEGAVYGLMLGPLAAAMATSSHRLLQAVPQARDVGSERDPLVADLVASLGAGIFEELVFRLVLLSLLSLLFTRMFVGFGLPKACGVLLAVASSAAAFALFHHVGEGAPPFERPVFLFRTAAGVILGLLFAFRGLGVCVYTHTLYDVHYYLTRG